MRRRTIAAVVAAVVLGLLSGGLAAVPAGAQVTEQQCLPEGGQPSPLGPLAPTVNQTVAQATGEIKEYKQTDPNGQMAEWLRRLLEQVRATRIQDREYVPDQPGPDQNYDCDDFAGDLERALEAMGYHATFTYIWCPPPGPPNGGHAVTDVHAPDGTVVWIEPQTGELITDMDKDGDGKVEYESKAKNHPKDHPTDGKCRIEVYESRAAAEAAGRQMDR